MLNKIFLVLLLIGVSTPSWADAVQVNPDHPDRYTVVEGDTLWDISKRFLLEPWRWPEIWQVNPKINNPHLIYPGYVIYLRYVDGQPVLTVEPGETPAEVTDTGERVIPKGGRDVKLLPQVREYERDDAIRSIPIEAIRHFLNRPLVVGKDEMDDWPYVVSNYDQHLVVGAEHKIYIRGLPDKPEHYRYSIYRKGPAYKSRDKYGNAVLGYEALYIGDVDVVKLGDPATGLLTFSNREIRAGDRLLPQPDLNVETDFIPRRPEDPVSGNIISVIDGVMQIGQYQVVVMDVGQVDGLDSGNVLAIYQNSPLVKDKVKSGSVQLPQEFTGVVLVFRVYDRLSYGLVMEAYGALHLNDIVRDI